MTTNFSPTPYGTVHVTTTHEVDFGLTPNAEGIVKRTSTIAARSRGLGERLSRRSHVIGDTVTVFDIYRKG